MRKSSKNKVIIIALVIIMALMSCKPKEKIARTVPARKMDMVLLEEILKSRKGSVQTLRFSKIRFDIKLDQDEFKLGGTIGLIKDSVIVVSIIPLLGYEIARIYCTKDSIIVINRSEKSFYKSGLLDEFRKFNLSADYYILESILMNNYFVYTEKATNRFHENSLLFRNGDYLIKSRERIKDELYFEQEQVIDAIHFGIKSIVINDFLKNEMIHIDYDLFNDYGDIYLPGHFLLNSSFRNYSLNLEMNYGDIEVNQTINADVKIPSSYKRLIL